MKYWITVTLVLSLQIASSLVDAQARDTNLGPDPNFKCPAGSSVAPHPERCDQYYTCYGGQEVYLWQCSGNLLYDLVYNGCNWPEQTYCGNRTVPGATTLAPYLCSDDGFFPSNSDQCIQNYYTCLDGTAFVTSCPSYGVFEPTRRICVSPSSTSCKVNNPSTAVPVTNTPYMTNPTTGYPNAGSTMDDLSTPSTTNKPVASTTPSSPGQFICPAGNGSYPDPSSCSHYYTCDNWVAYHFACPGGLVFNPTANICDWPYNVPGC